MNELILSLWGLLICQSFVNFALLAGILSLWRYVYLCERVRELKDQLKEP